MTKIGKISSLLATQVTLVKNKTPTTKKLHKVTQNVRRSSKRSPNGLSNYSGCSTTSTVLRCPT